MPRARTGTSYLKNGKWYVGIRLRDGRKWATPCPPREDGGVVNRQHASHVAWKLQQDYDAGRWDPEAAPKEAPAKTKSTEPAATTPAPAEEPVTVLAHARAWIKTKRYGSADKDKKRIEFYLAAAPLASMRIAEVRPRHVLAFIQWLSDRPSARGGKLSARSVRNVYDVVRRAFASAVIEDLIVASPCAPLSNALPTLQDKHPGARETWLFTREEVERLIADEALLPDRRVTYAILFLTGARWGELAALRWRDWNPDARPLGRLTISRAIEPLTKREKGTKTGAVKRVPVHPVLAEVLSAWKAKGFEAVFGRAPETDDFIMPSRRFTPRGVDNGNRYLHEDCKKLGLPPRHIHCTRRTFISLAQDDGGEPMKLKWVTHAPPRAVFDQYTTLQWKTLCAEVAKLEITLRRPAGAVVLPFEQKAEPADDGADHLATGTDAEPKSS
jgi:integrase